MAIGTDAQIGFWGTQDTLSNSTSAVTSTSYSVSGDQTTWTNDDDAENARVVLALTYGSSPTAGGVVSLYMRRLNIDSTNDEPTPDSDNQGSFVGSVRVDAVTSAQYLAVDIALKGFITSQTYEMYIHNGASQTLSSGWTVKITPTAPGPHA